MIQYLCPFKAYLTTDLEVLEEDYHEYVKVSHCKLSHFNTRGSAVVIHIFLSLTRLNPFFLA